MTPDNVRYLANYLDNSATIQDRAIYFTTGTIYEKLLEVPLGEIDPHATIVITVGLDNYRPNVPIDTDPYIGISDGTYVNKIWIREKSIHASAPCGIYGGLQDSPSVVSGTRVPAAFKLTFTPFYKFGRCETAQDGGYINTGRFNTQLDITKPLYLRVDRGDAAEQYYFRYFLVEIY